MTLFVKPRAQPGHKENEGKSTGRHRAGCSGREGPGHLSRAPAVSLPKVLHERQRCSSGSSGPCPCPQARVQVRTCPGTPAARPPGQSQTPQQPGGGPPGVQSQRPPGNACSRTLWCLPTGFSSCPHSTGTRVLPSADHPLPTPKAVSASHANGSAQQGWTVGTAVAAVPGLGDRKQRQPPSGQPQAGREIQPSRTETEGQLTGSSQAASPQASVQPKRGRRARGGGQSHQDLQPEAQISGGPQSGEFNGRAAPSSQPFDLEPAPLQWD